MLYWSMGVCFSCGSDLSVDKVFRTTVCPVCGKSVKACKNCDFYSPGAHWDCRETISEPVRDKDTVNFCEFFMLNKKTAGGHSEKRNGDSRTAFDKLFDN